MSAWWQTIAIRAGDLLWGWLLILPRDAAVMATGVGVAAGLLLLRQLTVNSARFQKIQVDQRRLRKLRRLARLACDREALTRLHRVSGMVAVRRIREESAFLLGAALLVSVLMPWGGARLALLPPRVDEWFELHCVAPSSMSGETVQIVPVADVEAENGWLRVFHPVASGRESGVQAVWRLRCRSPGVREFTLRLPGTNCVHTILVGDVRYEPVRKNCGESVATVVRLAEYRPLAILPARLIWGIPGWSGFLSLAMAAAYLAPKGKAAVVRRLRWVRHRGNSKRRREE